MVGNFNIDTDFIDYDDFNDYVDYDIEKIK